MNLRIFILVHALDDHGSIVTVHPSPRECYLELCNYYNMTPRVGGNINLDTFDQAVIQTGLASAMHDHDDGYEIYEQTIDTDKFGS